MNVVQSISDMIASVAENMASLSNSYIQTGADINQPGKINDAFTTNYEGYYDFLKDWHFLESLVSIFSSTLSEAINNTTFLVKVEKAPKFTTKINEFITKSNLKEFINSRLDDIVYRGNYSFGLDFKNNRVNALVDPYGTKMVQKDGVLIGYILDNKYIDRSKLVTYYYKPNDETVVTGEVKGLNIRKSKDPLESLVVHYSMFSGKSIFRGQLYRLFQLYVLEYIVYYMNLRVTVKPDILGMTTGGRQANVNQALNMANKVESILNESAEDLASVSSPQAFINQLTFSLLNYVKVVPSPEQYQNLTQIDSTQSKIPELQNQYDSIKRELLHNLTIPEELQSGNANRWEMMSRNDRFMTTNETMMRSITRLIKDITISYAKTFKIQLSYDDIEFDLDSSSLLANYDTKNRIVSTADKLSDVSRLLSTVKDLVSNDIVNPDTMYNYIKSQIRGIDAKLSSTLKDSIKVEVDTEVQ